MKCAHLACTSLFSRDACGALGREKDRGANLHARDHQGWTPIHYAVAGHSPSAIRLLIKHGANVNDTDSKGESLVIYATSNASIRSLQTLLECGADVNYRDPDGKTARGYCWDEDLLPLLQKAGAKE